MSHLSDEKLAELVLGGDIHAYGHLVERYQKLVFGVAFHSLGNAEDARDVAQDVFIRAFLRLAQLRDFSRIGSWLRQITVNECRAWTGRKRFVEELRDDAIAVDPIAKAEDRLLVSRALDAIDEPSRLSVILFYLHAYSLREIGSFLDEPVTTIKSRLRNARAKLRTRMEEILENNLSQESPSGDFAEKVTRMIEAANAGDATTILSLLQDDPQLLSAREVPGNHTPLHIAAASGDAAVVELLLAHGADPNAIDESDNASPLHYAAERGWLECVKLLVEAGANVNWDKTVHEASPLGWAVIFEPMQLEVADYLLAHGAEMDIFSAIGLGREDEVRALVAKDASVLNRRMSEHERRQTPIEFATSKKQFEIAHLLVSLGAQVTLADAAALGLVEQVSALLCDNPSASDLEVAVKASVQAGQIEATRLLLEQGANPDFAPQGTSLIFDAIAANNENLAKLLIAHGADLEFRDSQWSSTSIGWEVFFGRPEGVRLALSLGAQIDPHLLELARSGEKGELRRHSSGSPEGYRGVIEALEEHDR
jgi:RNA polymerase sigma factor (sigma-70 family)